MRVRNTAAGARGGRCGANTRRRLHTYTSSDAIATNIVTPADGPSFGIAPAGMWTWMSVFSRKVSSSPSHLARERMNERRSTWDDEVRAFDATPTAGVESSTYSDALASSNSPYAEPPTPLPQGLGSDEETNVTNDVPARA